MRVCCGREDLSVKTVKGVMGGHPTEKSSGGQAGVEGESGRIDLNNNEGKEELAFSD